MNKKILIVDDDADIRDSFLRNFRKKFEIDTAAGGAQGLEAIENGNHYAVILSDMQMPGMDGIQFLRIARDLSPDTVRMVLTGFIDQQAAIQAVNEGYIFRFLTKPCPLEEIAKALQAGLKQYQLVIAEKELLERTLKGSIKVLSDVLALINPTAFGRASRAKRLVTELARELRVDPSWQLEVATMLSQLGCVTLPEKTLTKVYRNTPLTEQEEEIFLNHPRVGQDLIGNIPRMEAIAEMIAYQEKHFDGTGVPADSRSGEEIPLGGRILKLIFDYDALLSSGRDKAGAIKTMDERKGWYDPALVKTLDAILNAKGGQKIFFLKAEELTTSMILAQDIKTSTGVLLVGKGQEVTESMCERLKNLAQLEEGIQEPLKVHVPDS